MLETYLKAPSQWDWLGAHARGVTDKPSASDINSEHCQEKLQSAVYHSSELSELRDFF